MHYKLWNIPARTDPYLTFGLVSLVIKLGIRHPGKKERFQFGTGVQRGFRPELLRAAWLRPIPGPWATLRYSFLFCFNWIAASQSDFHQIIFVHFLASL